MGRTKRSKELPVLYYYVGKRIQQIRIERNMSQDDLAKCLNLARTSIVNFEGGKQRIPLEDIYRMAFMLGLKAGDLLPEVSEAALKTTEQAFLDYLKAGGKE